MFYFIWLGAHGYDYNKSTRDESVRPPGRTDTASPYDLSKMIAANPDAPVYGPKLAFHHWGEPYFGYYVSNDAWVIRKHAQMLADAGVDVIFFDVTNARAYLPTVRLIADTFAALRREGRTTPSISFLLNSETPKVADRLYREFYQKNVHRDLWFFWKGKPLILAKSRELTPAQREFFSVRESWAWTKQKSSTWFGDGKDKWPWIDDYPQSFGWHESPAEPEEISVTVAQHPINNIGRSFHAGKQPSPGQEQPGLGLNFAEQWERALAVDPEFVFVTGWNEWVAMRFTEGPATTMLGKPMKKGDTYFVDTYNAEFSRDIEPMRGGFNDNYYLQLVSNIRRFKGARPGPIAKESSAMAIDGRFTDWADVSASYQDDAGDIAPRNHYGWGRIGRYQNHTGRNDLTLAKVAYDATRVYFYLEAKSSFQSGALPEGLTLWLKTPAGDYAVNRSGPIAILERLNVPGTWEPIGSIHAAISGNRIELSIACADIGFSSPACSLDFKWTDHCDFETDPMHAYDQGDAAPNGRFFYRFVSEAHGETARSARVSAAPSSLNAAPSAVR
jgi:hypothetical protein